MNFVKVKDLFFFQFINGICYRADIAVKYLAIKNLLEINNFGVDLYNETISKRIKFLQRKKDRKKPSIKKFKKLIFNIQKNGYNNRRPIIITKNNEIKNGCHRFSCAIFFNIEEVPIIKTEDSTIIDLSISWFREQRFSYNQISLIEGELKLLCKKMSY